MHLCPPIYFIKQLVYTFRIYILLVLIIVLNGVFREILGAFIDLFGLSGDTREELFEEGLVFIVIISLLFLRVNVLVLGDDLVEII